MMMMMMMMVVVVVVVTNLQLDGSQAICAHRGRSAVGWVMQLPLPLARAGPDMLHSCFCV